MTHESNPELAEYLMESELNIESIKNIIINYMKKQLKYILKNCEISANMMNSAHYDAKSRAFESTKGINDIIGANAALNSVQSINEMIETNAAFGMAQSINDIIGANAALNSVQSIKEMIETNAPFGMAQSINDIIGASAALNSVQSINEMIETNAAFGMAQSINDITGASAALNSVQSINEMIETNAAFGMAQSINDIIGASAALNSAQSISEMIKTSVSFGGVLSINEMWSKQIHTNDLLIATISLIPLKEIALSQALNSDLANLGKSFMEYFSYNSEFQQNYNQNKKILPTIASEIVARELFATTNSVKSIFSALVIG
jgi:hypothetical protein